jgi:hypothetical protein
LGDFLGRPSAAENYELPLHAFAWAILRDKHDKLPLQRRTCSHVMHRVDFTDYISMADAHISEPVLPTANAMVNTSPDEVESKVERMLGVAIEMRLRSRFEHVQEENERLQRDNKHLRDHNDKLQRDLRLSMARELQLHQLNRELVIDKRKYEDFFHQCGTKVPQMENVISQQETALVLQNGKLTEQNLRIERLERENAELRSDNVKLKERNKTLGQTIQQNQRDIGRLNKQDADQDAKIASLQELLQAQRGPILVGQIVTMLEYQIKDKVLTEHTVRKKHYASICTMVSGETKLEPVEDKAWKALLVTCHVNALDELVGAARTIKDGRNIIVHPTSCEKQQPYSRPQLVKVIEAALVDKIDKEYARKMLHALCVLKGSEDDVLSK